MGRAFEYRKTRKMKRWASMSKAFTRITKNLIMAVREDGANPETNYKLRLLIQNARQVNMPKENVERAIRKATDKDQGDYKTVVYEGYAQHGIAVLVETVTDNPTRTVANIRSYFNKFSGSLGTSGSVEFMFEHKCYFKVPGEGLDLEEFELGMIDYGVDGIFLDDENEFVMVCGPFGQFGAISAALDEKGMEIRESGTEYVPIDTKELHKEQMADVIPLLEMFGDDDDVQHVYSTLA